MWVSSPLDLALNPENWAALCWKIGYGDPRAGEERRAMKASRFSEAQKALILKQAEEGVPIGEVCRKAGISQATFYAWRKKYAGLLPTEMRRLRALEDENARLKKLVAELSLDKEMLQDAVRRKI
jgi:putative transposase